MKLPRLLLMPSAILSGISYFCSDNTSPPAHTISLRFVFPDMPATTPGVPPPLAIWPLNDFEARLPHHTLLWVEGGAFTMGSGDDEADDDEKHLRDVAVPSFCMAKFPVTQALYSAIMDRETPAYFQGADRPVERVSWDEAKAFVQKLNEKTGRAQAQWQYALPSEAQWEYAARGGNTRQNTKYAGSDKLKEVG